ncbi:MAG TPA: TolC family protein [Candidatus Paceibacterota bacterium]|nr:TolC family protein [Verrucomicrobiota bacterium]HRZ44038.1 TolC family protein [Candidatus Paceibacterota bacterium]HRZ91462.1 TolC family protein [Candidatus Paceibacterota bacterium]
MCAGLAAAAEPGDPRALTPLTLHDLRQSVIAHNEAILMRLLEAGASRKLEDAERGIFEPAVVASIDHIDTDRPNNRQQLASLGYYATPFFLERNTLYNAGLEFLLPSGARLRTGYTLRELNNNIGAPTGDEGKLMGEQYETFVGLSLAQPLLRGFGAGITMAKIRLAALASEIAFQEYRRQLMLTIANAESGYWSLYLMQEQDRFLRESIAVAAKILEDNRARLDVGKSSELEVLQAQAGLSVRQARWNEAKQKAYEGGILLCTLYSSVPSEGGALPEAVDSPEVRPRPASMAEHYNFAFELNPDYLIRRRQVEQEDLRVAYTKNQRRPQLDLKASYGLNGLGSSAGNSIDDMGDGSYPAWSVGIEMRIPLAGAIAERNQHRAAQMSKMRALEGLKEIETQIFNGLDAAEQKARLYQDSIGRYQSVVDFHEKLLRAQTDRLAVGTLDSRTVLETEERLFEAKVAVVESLVMHRKGLLELELVRGTLLQERNIEVSRDMLKNRTEEYIRRASIPIEAIEAIQREAKNELEQGTRSGS